MLEAFSSILLDRESERVRSAPFRTIRKQQSKCLRRAPETGEHAADADRAANAALELHVVGLPGESRLRLGLLEIEHRGDQTEVG